MGKQRTWTAGEIAWLTDQAGNIPLAQIAQTLGRSETAVKLVAHRRGLSLRCGRWGLSFCPSCASWRGAVGPNGKCAVCSTRERAERDRNKCERILASLTPERRSQYLANSAKSKGRVKPLPPRPSMPRSSPASAYERQRAQRRYALQVEAWELACVTRAANREKKRLQRLREVARTTM